MAWTRNDNVKFYESLLPGDLERSAEETGMNTLPDVELLETFVIAPQHILELGAGYGRFAFGVLARWDPRTYTLVEGAANYSQLLEKVFRDDARVEICTTDILEFLRNAAARKERYDLVCWPWTGITELPRSEQAEAIRLARRLTSDGGILYVDTFATSRPTNATGGVGANYCIEVNAQTLNAYSVSAGDLLEWIGVRSEIHFTRYPSKPGRFRLACVARIVEGEG